MSTLIDRIMGRDDTAATDPVTDEEANSGPLEDVADEDTAELVRLAVEEHGDEWPDDVEELLEPDEIVAGGGEREGDDWKLYKMDVPQLCEFERMDRATDDDKTFWAWFREFKGKNKLPKREPKKKRGRGTGGVQWDQFWKGGQSKTKYLSEQWSGGWSNQWYTSDQDKKLATALRSIQTTVRVVHTGAKRMRVAFAQASEAGPTNFTSYDEQLIVVSPGAILDKDLEIGSAVDITTGYALHEGSHAEHSQATMAAILEPSKLEPMTIMSIIHNLFEDIRIERLTGDNFPGFVGYFTAALDYLWKFVAKTAPQEWVDGDIQAQINAIIVGVKWPERYDPVEQSQPRLQEEMTWWRDETESYVQGTKPMRTCLIEARDRLMLDPKVKQKMEQMAADERAAGSMGQTAASLPEWLKRVLEKMAAEGKLKVIETCPSPGHSPGKGPQATAKLTDEQAKKVNTMVASEFQQDTAKELRIPIHTATGDNAPDFVTYRPQETDESKASHTEPPRGLVSRMRSAFFFRPASMQWSSRLQRTGSLDEDEVWKVKTGDFKVFEQRMIESAPDTSLTLLVDVSGSMGGSKMETSIQAAQIMHEVLKDTPGVRVKVRAHTGDTYPGVGGNSIIHKIWENGEPVSRLSTMRTVSRGNNYDGYAIAWCVRELIHDTKPTEQKVVIVLADGLPNGSKGYGNEPAYAHIREVVQWAKRNDVTVIQIAIDPSMDPKRQASMFTNWVPFEGIEKLPSQLLTLLKRLFY